MNWDTMIASYRQDAQRGISSAALRVVARQGVVETTMTDVAKEAGIARKTLYRYFPDVESILVAHVENEIRLLRDQMASYPEGVTPLKHLERCFAMALARWSEDPLGGVLGLGAGLMHKSGSAVRVVIGELRFEMVKVLEMAKLAKEVRADINNELVSDVMIGTMLGAREYILREGRPIIEIVDQIGRILLQGIGRYEAVAD